MRTKSPTIYTVAAVAGVSVSTVSRFLNGQGASRHLSARLEGIVAELGYTRSWTARNLSIGRRGCVGLIVDSVHDPWFMDFLTGVEEGLVAHETSLFLAGLGELGKADPSVVLRWIRERRVDGLIFVKLRSNGLDLLHAAQAARLRTVVVAPEHFTPGAQIVRCNNYAAGVAAAEHLMELGHERVAFAGGPSDAVDSADRLRGLRQGFQRRGLHLQPEEMFSCSGWEATAGSEMADQFFNRRLRVTAIVFANDALALGFMRVAKRLGIRVPLDLSIIGFDGLAEGALFVPSLTTLAQPSREMGRLASQELFGPLSQHDPAMSNELPMKLIVRESTSRTRACIA